MTIVRPSNGPGSSGDERGGRRSDVHGAGSTSTLEAVPRALREERLDRQIASFTRAGYRVETTTGLQAVLVRDRTPRPLRTALLAVATLGLVLLPRLLGGVPTVHRVVVTIDPSGAVRIV